MFRTLFLAASAATAYAVEDDLAMDLRMLMKHNATNDTKKNDTGLKDTNTTESIQLQVPATLDTGLGSNATEKDLGLYFNTMCGMKAYSTAYFAGVVKALGFDGLLASDLGSLGCSTKAQKRVRQLAAAGSKFYSSFKLTAKKDAAFMKAIAADPNASLLKDAVSALAANAGELSKGMASAMNAVGTTLKAALIAAGMDATLADKAQKRAAAISSADIVVDTDGIGGKDASGNTTDSKTLKAQGYAPASGSAKASTGGSTSSAFAAVVSVVAGSVSFLAMF